MEQTDSLHQGRDFQSCMIAGHGTLMTARDNATARDAWNRNAEFWNERMGDGNDFFTVLVWPAVERLLASRPGDRLLDVACGNGVSSRRLASSGAKVVAFDFSEQMIAAARE